MRVPEVKMEIPKRIREVSTGPKQPFAMPDLNKVTHYEVPDGAKVDPRKGGLFALIQDVEAALGNKSFSPVDPCPGPALNLVG